MNTYYVSLSRDLLHVYIRFEASSQTAVRQYLQREYFCNGQWKLPWCSIYNHPLGVCDSEEAVIVQAQCGPLYEEE